MSEPKWWTTPHLHPGEILRKNRRGFNCPLSCGELWLAHEILTQWQCQDSFLADLPPAVSVAIDVKLARSSFLKLLLFLLITCYSLRNVNIICCLRQTKSYMNLLNRFWTDWQSSPNCEGLKHVTVTTMQNDKQKNTMVCYSHCCMYTTSNLEIPAMHTVIVLLHLIHHVLTSTVSVSASQ